MVTAIATRNEQDKTTRHDPESRCKEGDEAAGTEGGEGGETESPRQLQRRFQRVKRNAAVSVLRGIRAKILVRSPRGGSSGVMMYGAGTQRSAAASSRKRGRACSEWMRSEESLQTVPVESLVQHVQQPCARATTRSETGTLTGQITQD